MAKRKTATLKKGKSKNKHQTIKTDKKIQNVIIVLGVFVLLVSCLSFVYIINMNIKINEILNDSKKEFVLESITPHYLFLGDSITEQYDLEKYFENYSVVNSGIGGNLTDDILNDLKDRVYKYNPSTIFFEFSATCLKVSSP